MADEKTAAESTAATTEGEATEAKAIGNGPEGGPIPGDPSSEPVATALQSWGGGTRTGPQTIAEDTEAPWHTPAGVTQVAPGTVLDEKIPASGAIVGAVPDLAHMGAGPYGGDTPADESPATVHETKPGEGPPSADELPAGVPVPSNKSASGGPVQSPPTGTSTAPDSSGSPASPSGGSASSGESGPVATESEPAGSDATKDTSAASAETSESADAAPATSTSSTSTSKSGSGSASDSG